MKMMHLGVLVFLMAFQGYMGYAQESNSHAWPQFRGQSRDGVSTEKLSTTDWNQSPPKLVWKKEIGEGFSELAVVDGVIYTMTSEKLDSISGFEFVVAYDENSGTELWRTQVDSMYYDVDGWGCGARATPSIDEECVYCFSGKGTLSAVTRKKGKLLWQVNFGKTYGSTIPRWGYASSPLLLGETVIMEIGGTENKAFGAFSKKDGKLLWASGQGNSSHDSPLLATIDGQQQIIFANGATLYSYTSEGDTLWTFAMPFGGLTAIPLLVDKNKIFLSGVRTPSFCIVSVENNKATEFLTGPTMKNDFSSSCYYNGYIYGFHVAALRCISAETGEATWTKRGLGKGSLILVDNQLLVLSDQGKLVMVDTNPEVYTEHGSVDALTGKSWTAPSFSNGKVFVRNLTEMACYQLN